MNTGLTATIPHPIVHDGVNAMTVLLSAAGLALSAFILCLAWPSKLRVTRIVDGDSLEGIWRGRFIRVRLSGYDAPEYRQHYGREARSHLATLLTGRSVRLLVTSRDCYGRHLAVCLADGVPVSWQMIWDGYGWPDGKLALLLSLYPRLRRLGLWRGTRPIHPSVWRKASHS